MPSPTKSLPLPVGEFLLLNPAELADLRTAFVTASHSARRAALQRIAVSLNGDDTQTKRRQRILHRWFEQRVHPACQSAEALTAAAACMKVGVDKGDPPIQALGVAIASLIGELLGYDFSASREPGSPPCN